MREAKPRRKCGGELTGKEITKFVNERTLKDNLSSLGAH